MGEFTDLGALEPTPENLIDAGRFFEGAWAGTKIKGTSYGVPWYVETRLVFYRTDLAKKAGGAPATDWDSLTALAKAYKQAGAKWGIGLQPGQTGSWQTVVPFGWSNGAELINDDETKFTFDTPELTEAVKYYQSYFTDGLSNKSPTSGATEADFVSGKVPMFISGPWEMSAVEQLGGKGFADKYDVSLFPKKKTSTSFVGGSDLAVFKGTNNRDAAWKVVEFLTTTKTQVAWYKMSTDLPSVKEAWNDPSLTSDKKLALFGEQLKSTMSPPTVPTWEQVAAKFDAQMEQVCKAGLDPAQAMKTVQQQATSIGTGQ